jgi:sirohydrochlorin ferrochelatase
MKALLLVAHGSRRKQSNDEVIDIAEKLKKNCGDQYGIVESAFLDLADILIPDGIERCIADGATSITVLPYFLNSGRHVVEDIPNTINKCMVQHPDVDISLAPHLGASHVMVDLLISSAVNARSV